MPKKKMPTTQNYTLRTQGQWKISATTTLEDTPGESLPEKQKSNRETLIDISHSSYEWQQDSNFQVAHW